MLSSSISGDCDEGDGHSCHRGHPTNSWHGRRYCIEKNVQWNVRGNGSTRTG